MLIGGVVWTLVASVALGPLPATKSVAMSQLLPETWKQQYFLDATSISSDAARCLLKRRNGVEMYGKVFDTYPVGTPEYLALELFDDTVEADHGAAAAPLLWDALLIERPDLPPTLIPDTPCFLAMNRFPVKAECAHLFEERWATRQSLLPQQPGLLGFSLLRRRSDAVGDVGGFCGVGDAPLFTYSTATLWASEAAWSAWREGPGKDSHAVSRLGQRTPVSDWLEGPASPIFWDVPVYLHAKHGITHVCRRSTDSGWERMLARLVAYQEKWGNADAILGPGEDGDLGRWCKVQRTLYAEGKLSADRMAALDALAFSWTAPSDVDDPLTQADWDAMIERLRAYRAEHGSCDVAKKYQPDPALGGWVAAVRRCRSELGEERVAELDALGFAWISARQCGSAFMATFRELRAFYVVHGHTDVSEVQGEDTELARWCVAMRDAQRQGNLSPKRLAYLKEVGW